MLGFVIPLKSKKVSQSWESTSKLFERSIKSVCNQSESEFRVIVVCHEKPDIEFVHPNVTYIEVNYPVPTQDYKSKKLDREQKTAIGIIESRNLNLSHIMVVDADDCISRHLAKFVSLNRESYGWFINKGYSYKDRSKLIKIIRKGFDRYCGTSIIIRADLYNFPIDKNEDELGDYMYRFYEHRQIRSTLTERGTPVDSLPFVGAVYIEHGDNNYLGKHNSSIISLKSRISRAKSYFDYRLLTTKIRQDFSLYDLEI
jgi:hypothetical protein